MNYIQFLKKFTLILLPLLYLHSTSVWAEIYIDFFEDGKIEYSLHSQKRKNTGIQVDEDWVGLKQKIHPNDMRESCFFKARFLEHEGCYELKLKTPISEQENLNLRIPHNISVKFEGSMNLHALTLRETYPRKLGGTFVNMGDIVFVDTDKDIKNSTAREQSMKKYGLHIENASHFKNKNKLSFGRQVIFALNKGFLTNGSKGVVQFTKEARIVGENINLHKNNFLLFTQDEHPPLVNKGRIEGFDKLGLFSKCFVSETGRIQAKPIIMDWNGNNKLTFNNDLRSPVPLRSEDIESPILDIVRIPDFLREEYASDVGELGEAAARHFYKQFMNKHSFSHKANSQENGIDVISYDNKNPHHLIIHESKNYHDGSFALGDNQMTQSWVYGYLFKMYQDFIKENICILETGRRKLPEPSYDHLKSVLSNILEDGSAEDLQLLLEWVETKNISQKNQKYVNATMSEILKLNAASMTLNDYKTYFSEELYIFARGNSILHCVLPKKNNYNFGQVFTEPTYFIRRNVSKRFSAKGVPPQAKG